MNLTRKQIKRRILNAACFLDINGQNYEWAKNTNIQYRFYLMLKIILSVTTLLHLYFFFNNQIALDLH